MLDPQLTAFAATLNAMVRGETRDMTARQLVVLMEVAKERKPPIGVRELADGLGISKPAVTRATQRLMRDGGLIRRRNSPMDMRLVEFSIAKAGTAYLGKLAKASAAAQAAA